MKSSVILVCFAAVLMLAGAGLAHPPKDVQVEFNPDNHMMMVMAMHDTKDATKHFVGTIEVSLNGDKLIDQKFKSQPTADMQMGHYLINDVKIGDQLTVIASCSIAGKKTVTIKVEKPKPAEGMKHGQ
ncbi:MAG: hypothetical protein V1694_11650 [Candidatus Eisenbacteria bacterium]